MKLRADWKYTALSGVLKDRSFSDLVTLKRQLVEFEQSSLGGKFLKALFEASATALIDTMRRDLSLRSVEAMDAVCSGNAQVGVLLRLGEPGFGLADELQRRIDQARETDA